ncbi:MAG: 50S ribosomal protein L19 [Candidatus Moraniibacteriota bacterium]|nr:MAG: 50S ribosomal protein L19 [Candidatus Moranbacteria bacterium]
MDQKLIAFNLSQRRTDLPPVRTGDVVRITRKIKEGGKERLQVFEGMIIAKKGGQSASPTITVRKISFGVGVEIIFPLNSPQVQKIDFVKRTKAGRSKIYYVRDKSAKVLSRKLKEIPAKDMLPEQSSKKTPAKPEPAQEESAATARESAPAAKE